MNRIIFFMYENIILLNYAGADLKSERAVKMFIK